MQKGTGTAGTMEVVGTTTEDCLYAGRTAPKLTGEATKAASRERVNGTLGRRYTFELEEDSRAIPLA